MNQIQSANEVEHENEGEEDEDDFEVRGQYNHTLRSSVSYLLAQLSKLLPEETF